MHGPRFEAHLPRRPVPTTNDMGTKDMKCRACWTDKAYVRDVSGWRGRLHTLAGNGPAEVPPLLPQIHGSLVFDDRQAADAAGARHPAPHRSRSQAARRVRIASPATAPSESAGKAMHQRR